MPIVTVPGSTSLPDLFRVPPRPISVNNQFVFSGLGGGRRCKVGILLDLDTELLESITYSNLQRFIPGKLAKSDGALWLENGLELLSGHCFKVIVLGGFLVGILWGF